MSAVSESMNRRMTLGLLASRYGFDLDPAFATEVTVTSIADDIDSVRPGALFIPSTQVDEQQLRQVQALGAYGAVVPHALRGKTDGVQIPLIYAEPTAQQLGKLASEMAGSPSDSLAVFAVAGSNTQTVEQGVRDLADFLHMLGNPVGVISAGNSQSLERFLDLNYPLSILDVQRTMAVCAEDGAAAVILALSEETLNDDALQSVNVDVLGCDDKGLSEAEIVKSVARFDALSASRPTSQVVRRNPMRSQRKRRRHTGRRTAARCHCPSPWCLRPAYVRPILKAHCVYLEI